MSLPQGWRYFDDDSVTKIKTEKVISQDAYVLMYRVRGAQNAVKLDRFTTLSNTMLSSTCAQENSSVLKRKHATDSTSTKAERRSASESTLGVNLKRSMSAENPNDGRKSSDSENSYSSPGLARRCASALPSDHGARKRDNSTPTQQGGNLTSSSLPNVAMDVNKTIANKKLEKEASGSEEILGSFENLTLDDVIADKDVFTSPENLISSTTETIIDVTGVNENDLD